MKIYSQMQEETREETLSNGTELNESEWMFHKSVAVTLCMSLSLHFLICKTRIMTLHSRGGGKVIGDKRCKNAL